MRMLVSARIQRIEGLGLRRRHRADRNDGDPGIREILELGQQSPEGRAAGEAVLPAEEDQDDAALVRQIAEPDVLAVLVLQHEVRGPVADRHAGRAVDFRHGAQRDPAAESENEDDPGSDLQALQAFAAPGQRQHRGGKGEEAQRPPAVPERRHAEEQDVGDPDADRREDGQDERQLLHCLTSRK